MNRDVRGRAFDLFALLACCALLAPALAEAQAVHVTNLGQTVASSSTNAGTLATSFTTGGASADRFVLDSVVVKYVSGASNTTAHIFGRYGSESPTGNADWDPLVRQGSATSGNITFNAPASGIVLNGNTTYFLYVRSSGSGHVLAQTASGAEDSSSASGWSIGNVSQARIAGEWSDHGNPLLLRVDATPAVALKASAITPTGASLSLANHGAAWYWKGSRTSAPCNGPVAAAAASPVSGLGPSVSYTFKAYSDSACGTELTTDYTDARFRSRSLFRAGGLSVAWASSLYARTRAYVVFRTTGNAGAVAFGFTTGGTPAHRYELDNLALNIPSGSGQVVVRIHENAGGIPGPQIGGDLTGAIDAGGYEEITVYTASGITLTGGQSYFVVLAAPSGTNVDRRIAMGDEPAAGSYGWSVAKGALARAGSGAWSALSAVSRRWLKVWISSASAAAPGPEIWSATLTPGNDNSSSPDYETGCSDVSARLAPCNTALSPAARFVYGGTAYTITQFRTETTLRGEAFELFFDSPIPKALSNGGTLTIDGKERGFQVFTSGGIEEHLTWQQVAAPLNWTEGRPVRISLRGPGPLRAPANLRATAPAPRTLALAWDAEPGAADYGVQYRVAGYGFGWTERLTARTELELTGLDGAAGELRPGDGVSYDVRVRARVSGEDGPWASDCFVTLHDLNHNIDCYPNGGGGGGGGGGDGGGGGGSPPPSDGGDDGDDGDDSDGGDGDDDSDEGGPPEADFTVSGATCDAELCRARTGAAVTFENASTGVVRSLSWNFGDGRRSGSGSPRHAWSSPGFYEVTLSVSDGTVESTARKTFLVEASEPAGTCVADAGTSCLQDSRFAVAVEWRKADGEAGAGRVVHEGTNDSGLFSFFGAGSWEALVKVLDGCPVNGHVWVFGASATDLGYVIRVTDTVTGAVREYRNEPGRPAPAITDSEAFPTSCSP